MELSKRHENLKRKQEIVDVENTERATQKKRGSISQIYLQVLLIWYFVLKFSCWL